MGETQAEAILRAWQESGRTVTAGLTATRSEWFARIEGGPTFGGESLVDALGQLATWLQGMAS
jgi:hypothetical protein